MDNYKLLQKLAANRSILIIEDDKELNIELSEIFAIFFTKIASAFDAEEGLKKLRTNDFDIVISDITIPKKSGLKMISEFRAGHSHQSPLPNFIVLSGHVENYLEELQVLDIEHFLAKPYDPDTLFDIIISILESKSE